MSDSGPQVWVADDDAAIRWVLQKALQKAGIPCQSYEDAEAVLAALDAGHSPGVLLTDICMPGADGLDLLAAVRQRLPQVPVIVITARSDLDSAVNAYQGGAFEYLPKPFDVDQAVELVKRALAQCDASEPPASQPQALSSIIGQAPAMQGVFRAIGRLSSSSMTVLITGESGTGKELVARALHEHSPRSAETFVGLNISAIPAELLESELFGHERGAFTGADRQRKGRFEQASGGTLFLDEIGDMVPALQTRLLRVLAEGEFFRIGGQSPIRVNTRVLAATNQDLAAKVARGDFRDDLYHRLNVIRIEIPPLRQRREDIPALVGHYLSRLAGELGVPAKTLAPAVMNRLVAADWPGNVRQLVNICRRLIVSSPGRDIRLQDLPPELGGHASVGGAPDWTASLAQWASQALARGESGLLERASPAFETALIRAALAAADGKRHEAARMLGWGRNTLSRKIRELGLDEEEKE
ncbi:MAG: nitrogen regulation protein NR(I) [Gammaproteobacteria bacterium]|nr:nitrogen regulation protein NR(I) [Gammaproteobacteria bacterium]